MPPTTRRSVGGGSTGLIPWVLIGILVLTILYQAYSCGIGREDVPQVRRHKAMIEQGGEQGGILGAPRLNARGAAGHPSPDKYPSVRELELEKEIKNLRHELAEQEQMATQVVVTEAPAGGHKLKIRNQDEEHKPEEPAVEKLNEHGSQLHDNGEKFFNQQAKNELRRLEGIVREQQEMQQKQRVETRRHRSAQRKKPKKPEINCQCSGLSAMDPRYSWCNAHSGHEGQSLSPSHVCIATDVCVDRGGKLHFLSPLEQPQLGRERSDFSIQLANAVNLPASIVYRPVEGAAPDYWNEINNTENYRRGLAYDHGLSSQGRKAPHGTLVVLGHSAAVHITHFLEPVGSLQVGVRDMMMADSEDDGCAEDDLNCFYRPSLTVSNSVQLDNPGLWGQNVLRVVYGDTKRKMSFKKASELDWEPEEKYKCFKKGVIPGAFYGIWPQGADTRSFHSQLNDYVDQLREEAHDAAKEDAKVGDTKEKRDKALAAVPPVPPRNPKTRAILLAHRTSKRTIVDWDNFVKIVTKHAATVGAKVTSVLFGSKKFYEQAALAEEAGIMMGIHGADLTNMIFQKTGSVVVEINPLFFFENRFYEMASALGHKYLPWNCGTHECAFGGDRAHFDAYMNSHSEGGLTYNATDYTFTTKKYGTFEWGWKGYVGFGCVACNDVTCCTGVRNGFYSELRESHVKIGPPDGRHAREMRSLLDDAFKHLKWDKISH